MELTIGRRGTSINYALDSFTGQSPKVWMRYVDDTFVILNRRERDRFFEHINACDQFIKFTQEEENENSIPFLDCLIKRRDGCLITSVYRKETHTDQYLSFDSHHPLSHKQGVVRTLHHRADNIVSNEDDLRREKEHLDTALSHCKYPKWAIKSALFRPRQRTEPISRPKTIVTLPYVNGVSEVLQRKFKDHGIQVAHKPAITLRQLLVHPKDVQEKERTSGVVYHIKCEGIDCNDSYIGETEQPLKNRMSQHRHATGGGITSAVGSHLKAKDHMFENENVDILCREHKWFERGVKEAIFLKEKTPSLNKLGGARFVLSSAWNEILQKPRESSRATQVSRHSQNPFDGSGTLPRY